MHSKENRDYWNKINSDYSRVWIPKGRQEMSKRELSLIKDIVLKFTPHSILDVGIGNGRILKCLIKFSHKDTKIFGIDISEKMVNICKLKFNKIQKIKELKVCDISKDTININDKFDLVTMIRVLKYNENWKSILKKIFEKLRVGGIYIFTMPNSSSISRFSGDTFSEKNIPILYSSAKELRIILDNIGFTDVEFRSFSKLPNFLYHINTNEFYVTILIKIEKSLEKILGKSFLGRELFVICKK